MAPAARAFADSEAFLAAHAAKDVLRFITCGSVDDGKSTLIGRLLHDSKQLFEDQLIALERDSRTNGSRRDSLDFSLLVDGLSAEREQGITIDVAYRFFSTDRRTFIVADTPGHEQYTRNMATAASTAELAVLLVDVRKRLTRQTRRHSLLVSMLGVRRVVLAINKMDLIGWSEEAYRAVMEEYLAFAQAFGFEAVTGIPLSALNGDNVVEPAVAAPWYQGPTLLRALEEAPAAAAGASARPFRMAVQRVSRPNDAFRGYAGRVSSGAIAVGDTVVVSPSGTASTVARIATFDGDLDRAVHGQSVTLTLKDDLDISRGDVLADPASPPHTGDRLAARLFWIGRRPLSPLARLHLKVGAVSAKVAIDTVICRVDPDRIVAEPARELAGNEIGDVTLFVDREIAFDVYAENRDTGSFILIDPDTCDTVAMGLIQASERPPSGRS